MGRVFTLRGRIIEINILNRVVLVLDDGESDIEIDTGATPSEIGEKIKAWVTDTLDVGKPD